MLLYAIEIRKSNLALITLLNSGVTPEIEKKSTYFLFDATWNTDFVPQILDSRECWNTYEIKNTNPMMFAVKKY